MVVDVPETAQADLGLVTSECATTTRSDGQRIAVCPPYDYRRAEWTAGSLVRVADGRRSNIQFLG